MERAKKRAAKAKAARELSEDDLARIAEMLNNGVSQRKIAEAIEHLGKESDKRLE